MTPRAGVTVRIGGHPEYGQTLTRSDGSYDLAVNGGGVLLVDLAAAGMLPLQRHAVTKPLDFTVVDDVISTTVFASGDTFTPGVGSPQIVRGAQTGAGVDADAARRARLYFPANTNFTNFTPPGGPLAIAITEYTVANGVRRMPGELPPAVGYTYAVELAVPAAAAEGIAHPAFDKDVVMYVDNFTGYPVGQTVPLGYYDHAKGAWVGDESGRIVKVSSKSGGLANLIIAIGGGDATPSELAAIGIDADERAAIASEFSVGTELWRTRMRHFSAWDANWGFAPPMDAESPPSPDPKTNTTSDDTKRCGSIVGCESQTLGEEIPIVGTPYKLHYQSERSAGYLSQVTFRVTGDTVLAPAPLRIHIEIDVAGRHFAYEKAPPFKLYDTFTFTWDGRDAYGRQVTGTYEAKLRIGYEYAGVTTGETPLFGVPAGATITGDRLARTATLATAGDPFSVTSQTITTTRSGSGLVPSQKTSVFTSGPPAKWTTTSPAGRMVEVTLDTLERVTQVKVLGSVPVTLHPLDLHYDSQGRIDLVTRGSRTYGTTFHPTTGWVSSTTAPEGLGVTFDSRDANGRPLLTTLPGGRQVATSFDASGNLISVTPPSQPAHAFSFDPNDRMWGYDAPGGTHTTYDRDRDGLTLVSFHPGNSVSYRYDSQGRVDQTSSAVTTTIGRDPQGRVSTIATSDGVTLTNTWDGSLLAQQNVTGPFAHSVQKTHDDYLRVSSWTIDGASPIALNYDGDDLVTSAGGMSVGRSLNGLLTNTSIGVVTDTFKPNAYGELEEHSITGSSTAYKAVYDRDGAGRIRKKTETVGTTTHVYDYEYDPAGRLWNVYIDSGTPTRTWTYDANGNRSDGTHDNQDRLLTQGNLAFEYAPNGELLQERTLTPAATVFDYTYDGYGNLRTAVRASPGLTIQYVIDGQNRRIGKKYGASLVQGFLYDGPRIVAELNGAGAVVSRFVYGTQSHSPDLMLKGGTTYRIVKDHLGSPLLVVNTSSGAVVQTITYDEWGNASETGTEPLPFGFAGGLWDRDTGFVRFGARDYDPTTGRWTTKDRSRFRGGLNFYGYCGNDPVNWIDISGRMRLPATPDSLGPEWTRDPNHRPPGGSKWNHPSGDSWEFHLGKPGAKGDQDKDHWHHWKDGKKQPKHYFPGDEVPDPPQVCEEPNKSDGPDPNDDEGAEEYAAHVPWWLVLPFIPWFAPAGAPELVPILGF